MEIHIFKLRIEMGDVSKRQQPDQRAENSQRPPMGLQYSEKIQHQEICLHKHISYFSLSLYFHQLTLYCFIKTHVEINVVTYL